MLVRRVYGDLVDRVFHDGSPVPRLVKDSSAGGGRHYGRYYPDQNVIGYAPDLERAPITIIRGVLAHEIGHALATLWGVRIPRGRDAEERQADRLAEEHLRLRIYYDADNVQRAGRGARGKRPRPLGVR